MKKYLVNTKNKTFIAKLDFRKLALRAYKDFDAIRQIRTSGNINSLNTTTSSIPNYIYDVCTNHTTKEDFLKTVVDHYWNLLLKDAYQYHHMDINSNIRWGNERFQNHFKFPKSSFDLMLTDFNSLHKSVYDFANNL